MNTLKICDVVATLFECSEWHIERSQVGTVVEELDGSHVLVEFANLKGVAYATLALPVGQLLRLKKHPDYSVSVSWCVMQKATWWTAIDSRSVKAAIYSARILRQVCFAKQPPQGHL